MPIVVDEGQSDLDWTALGDALEARRKELQLDQSEVSGFAGISVNSLSRLENGRSARVETLVSLARVLGWSPLMPVAILVGEQLEQDDPILEEDTAQPDLSELVQPVSDHAMYFRVDDPAKISKATIVISVDLGEATVAEPDLTWTAESSGEFAQWLITRLAHRRAGETSAETWSLAALANLTRRRTRDGGTPWLWGRPAERED